MRTIKKRLLYIIACITLSVAVISIILHTTPLTLPVITRMLLLPLERGLQVSVDIGSSKVIVARNISLRDVTVVDEKGRFYYCKTANLGYRLIDLLFGEKATKFRLQDVKFYRDVDIINSVTDMLVISKIPDIQFEEIRGLVRIHNTKIYIEDLCACNNSLRIKGKGWIDKNGELDCDLHFSFHSSITDKIPETVKKMMLSPQEKDWMGVRLKVSGDYKKPSLHIASKGLRLNVTESYIKQ